MQNCIGLMSGTSLDGIDAALLETDGVRVGRAGAAISIPYDADMRALLRTALQTAAATETNASTPVLAEAQRRLTEAHGQAVAALLRQAGCPAQEIAIIGFHGQTVLHRPQLRRTWQIGDGDALARMTGIDVAYDFRSADVAAGGEGAPLVPLYHQALAVKSGITQPVAVVNIGGVANVTYVGETLLAFDTGPGNAPIDDWAAHHIGRPVDLDGALAAAGTVDESVLSGLLAHSFFDRIPPKSLDRFDFGFSGVTHLSAQDGAATLTAFTAAAIARAAEHFPTPVARWIICGGGRHNPVLMRALGERTSAPVAACETLGWRGDFLEAEAFAFLAMRCRRGLPLSLPTTTGVRAPMAGGRIAHAPAQTPP